MKHGAAPKHSEKQRAPSGPDEILDGPFGEAATEAAIKTILKENAFQSLNPMANRKVQQIWAVGGGKGGVGKSLLSSSLAITLARQGKSVTAIDLDLGGANLHTTLGIEMPPHTIGDFLAGRQKELKSIAVETETPGLHLISGAQDAVHVADIHTGAKAQLLNAITSLPTDYVVIDLGAGTSFNTIDFFLFADLGFVTFLPEPTSIENAYRFIKGAYYRRLALNPKLSPLFPLIQAAMDSRNPLGIKSPADLMREAQKLSPELGMLLKSQVDKFQPKLVINQVRTQTDIEIGFSVKTVCKRYFGIEMDYVGYLDHDSAVWQSVRKKRPLLMEFPNSRIVSSVDRMVQYLLKKCQNQRSDLY